MDFPYCLLSASLTWCKDHPADLPLLVARVGHLSPGAETHLAIGWLDAVYTLHIHTTLSFLCYCRV